MPPTVIPVLQTWGTQESLRYALTDTAGRYWDGSGWSDRQRDARLYAGHDEAAEDARQILSRQFRKHTVYQSFAVPLEMEVYAFSEVTPDELIAYAKKAFKFSILYANHGTGPRPDSLVLPVVKWGWMTQPHNSERDLSSGD